MAGSTFQDAIIAYKALKEVCFINANGFAEYKNGLNDSALAKKLGIRVSTVATVRNQEIGKTAHGAMTSGSKTRALVDLEARVARIEKELGL